MLKNYLKTAWRSVMRHKGFSFINIFGLSIGLTCCMLISLYLYREFNYDKYQGKGKDLYLVGTEFINSGVHKKMSSSPSPLAPTLKQEYPEVLATARLMGLFVDDKTLMQYTEGGGAVRSFYETRGYLADSTFFNLFDYDFVEGKGTSSLMEPNSLVLSEEIARKIFGKESALNKTVHINSTTNGSFDYKVTGVFRPKTAPSHINANFFLSMSSGQFGDYVKRTTDFASNNMFYTYVLLKPTSDGKSLEKKLPAFVEKYMRKDLTAAGFDKREFLMNVRDIHLIEDVNNTPSPSGSRRYLYILASIAAFILLIGCINFMNLATARSARRAAEVGVRKVLGAQKNSLIRQFLAESILLAFLSYLIAIGLVQLLLPFFSHVAGSDLTLFNRQNIPLFIGFTVLTFATGLISGSYPAFYLSAFKPIRVLKGKFVNSFSAVAFRKVLVVFQFTISVVLIIAAFVIGKQMSFMRSTDLGFAKDQQLIIPLRSTTAKNMAMTLKKDLVRSGQVIQAGASFYYPGIFNPSDVNFYGPGQTSSSAVNTKLNFVDESFMQTLNLKLLAGRLFSAEYPGDTGNLVIINEMASRKLGFRTPQDAIEQTINRTISGNPLPVKVVGVINDFHFEGLKAEITPYGFGRGNDDVNYNYLIAHVNAGALGSILKTAQAAWKKLNPNEPFEYSFLDQDFQKNYEAEERLSSLVMYFTIIAILISCLGLFGLASFSAEQRIKEIGVRKVLGASVGSIVALLSKDFLRLIFIAIVIASPVAWWIMHNWLQDFAYRTEMGWTVFVFTALLAVFIAVFTISFQAIKAAIANPVKSLRAE
ncbi:MAG TPA: ABC transporter permease [Chitinophagaceae bacterium]|nr:ABC transporter permease [Chitinophagaceae bacterium]